MNKRKLLLKAYNGPNNLRFHEFVELIEAFGFQFQRTRGSHHLFAKPGLSSIVNVQEHAGKAKPYQVRQFLELIERYELEFGEAS